MISSQYCCSTEMCSSSLSFFTDLNRNLWQMNPSVWIAFSSSGAKCIDSFQQETSNCMSCLCQMLVQVIQQSVSYSFLSSAISSWFWLLAPLLSLSCFVKIAYQKIAVEQLSSNCAFLFFISSAPNSYLSFISSPLLDFSLCFTSGTLCSQKIWSLQILLPIRHVQIRRSPCNLLILSLLFFSPDLQIFIWTAMPLRHTLPFLNSFLPRKI